jgi:hypothetical protein
MGFWSGFEGLTGHKPGAFKGFSLKDILDKDMWERRERLNQGRRFEETGVPETTNWYRGRGRPEMMGPRVGEVEVGMEENLLSANPDMYAGVNQGQFDATTLANQQRRNALWGSGPDTVSAARPWANIQAQMLGGMGQGDTVASQAEAARLNAINSGDSAALRAAGIMPAMADKTIVKKTFADPSVSDTITETIKEKVPTGAAQWGNSRHPPNWQNRVDTTSLMNMLNPQSWQDVIRRKFEERQRARRLY